MNNIVVLGSSGYVGAALAAVLGISAISVRGVSSRPGRHTHIEADLTDPKVWEVLPQSVDAVINAAAIVGQRPEVSEQEYTLANVLIPQMAAKYAASAGAFLLHLSTAGVYGYRDKPSTEATPPNPPDIYNITKYQGETACFEACPPDRLAILRLSFPYGSNQARGLVPTLIRRIRTGEPVILNTRDGRPRVSPLHLDDCCAAILAVLDKRVNGVYNCSGIEDVSILELSEILGEIIGNTPILDHKDDPCKDLLVDSRALQKAGDWRPAISLREGLKQAVENVPD